MLRWIFAVILSLWVLPVLAAPNDETMSGAFRCAAISDNKTWLECYYGAAQPVRAALGLPPAPQAQLQLVQSPPAGLVTRGDQALRNSILEGAFRCTGPDNQHQWLNCYYAAAQPMRTHFGLPPSPPLAASPPAQSFGLRPALPPANNDNFSARMSAYTFDRYGVFTVTLDNGQVWQQLAGDDTRAHWSKHAGRYVVRIEHGLLGAYNFRVRNEPGLYRVRRIN
ncbi:MAG: hypothetical protein H0U98_10905 [Alphaproteobacteria bacterium]|nr:hypothetical protein [Alphaproteobacteria bacterium]